MRSDRYSLFSLFSMETENLIISWFNELGKSRADLPYELTRVYSDNEKNELEESIRHSLKHIDRILGYRNILNDTYEDDEEEFWEDVLARLDDTSYYVCMVMPFLREMLEPSTDYLFKEGNNKFQVYVMAEISKGLPDIAKKLKKPQSEFVSKLWLLGHEFSYLNNEYSVLNNMDDFILWNKQFLGACAKLLVVVSEISLPEKYMDFK